MAALVEEIDGVRPKPPLKWAGGKRWLVPHLQKMWKKHARRRLVEPFCGGLAVTLGLLPASARLNDINAHAIAFYRWLQRGLVIDRPMLNEKEAFYQARERFNELLDAGQAESKEFAEIFYYLNRTAYNGLCRFNRSGRFNVPFGSYTKIRYTRDFSGYREVFRNWDFTHGDFETIALDPGDLVYADPPYDVEFTQYSKEIFGWPEQVRLAQWLARHPGPVVLSNQATPRIVSLYKDLGFRIKTLEAPRMISCNGDRTPALEVLALKGT